MKNTTMTETEIETAATDRNGTIAALKRILKERTGRTWSVRGGQGTSWGWIDVVSMPKQQVEGSMTDADKALLSAVFSETVHHQGVSIAASTAHRREYLRRAAGLSFAVAAAYWD